MKQKKEKKQLTEFVVPFKWKTETNNSICGCWWSSTVDMEKAVSQLTNVREVKSDKTHNCILVCLLI